MQNGFGHTPCVGILSGYFNKLRRKNRISIDQAVAGMLGNETRFRSLVFQAGENLDFSQIAWDEHGLPVHQIDSPRKIFNLLFQVNENEQTQQQILAEDRSILDAVFRQAKSMEKRLNATDRAKIDEYLTSVREVEQTVKRRAYWAERSKPSGGLRTRRTSTASRWTITWVTLAGSGRIGPANRLHARRHGADSVLGRFQGGQTSPAITTTFPTTARRRRKSKNYSCWSTLSSSASVVRLPR